MYITCLTKIMLRILMYTGQLWVGAAWAPVINGGRCPVVRSLPV